MLCAFFFSYNIIMTLNRQNNMYIHMHTHTHTHTHTQLPRTLVNVPQALDVTKIAGTTGLICGIVHW